jgi:hypothetical protein
MVILLAKENRKLQVAFDFGRTATGRIGGFNKITT